MAKTKFRTSEGNTPSNNSNYGKALMRQKGGWTLGELKPDRESTNGELTKAAFERVLKRASSRVSEPASGKTRTSE